MTVDKRLGLILAAAAGAFFLLMVLYQVTLFLER